MRKMHCSKSMRFHIVFANVKTMVWLREVISVSRLSGRLAKACQSGRQGLSLKIEIKFPGTGFAGHAIPKSIVCCAHRIGFKQMKHPPWKTQQFLGALFWPSGHKPYETKRNRGAGFV
jgi:hypothetical protein